MWLKHFALAGSGGDIAAYLAGPGCSPNWEMSRVLRTMKSEGNDATCPWRRGINETDRWAKASQWRRTALDNAPGRLSSCYWSRCFRFRNATFAEYAGRRLIRIYRVSDLPRGRRE